VHLNFILQVVATSQKREQAVVDAFINVSQGVQKEVELALSRDIRVIPVRIERGLLDVSFQYMLKTTKWVELAE
jgi:hypothetical protein